LKAGQLLHPQDLGLLASVGCAKVKVLRKLRVAVLFTGDELKQPKTGPKWGCLMGHSQILLRWSGCKAPAASLNRKRGQFCWALKLWGLEQRGVLVRNVQPTSPPSVEYALTDLGGELVPALEAIVKVGHRLKALGHG
jgi:hypothetical protein